MEKCEMSIKLDTENQVFDLQICFIWFESLTFCFIDDFSIFVVLCFIKSQLMVVLGGASCIILKHIHFIIYMIYLICQKTLVKNYSTRLVTYSRLDLPWARLGSTMAPVIVDTAQVQFLMPLRWYNSKI